MGIDIHGLYIEAFDGPEEDVFTRCIVELHDVVGRDYTLFALLGGFVPSAAEADEYPARMVGLEDVAGSRMSSVRARHQLGEEHFMAKWRSPDLGADDLRCDSSSLTVEEVRAVARAYRKATGCVSLEWGHALELATIVARWEGGEDRVRLSFCFDKGYAVPPETEEEKAARKAELDAVRDPLLSAAAGRGSPKTTNATETQGKGA